MTIRLSFSIEPHRYDDLAAEDAGVKDRAGSNEQFTEKKHVLENLNSAFTAIAESPDLVGPEQDKDGEDDSEQMPNDDIQHTDNPATPSEVIAEGMLGSAIFQENVAASEGETTELPDLSRQDVELKDADLSTEMISFTPVTESSAQEPEVKEPEQILRSEAAPEPLQLHVSKYNETEFGSSQIAKNSVIAEAHLELEGTPEAEDEEDRESVRDAKLTWEHTTADEEIDRKVLLLEGEAAFPAVTAEEESKSTSNPELPEVLTSAGELDPADSVPVDSLQKYRDLHQEHQITAVSDSNGQLTAVSDSNSQLLIIGSGEHGDEKVWETHLSSAEASSVEDEGTADTQEPYFEQDKEVIAKELWQMEAQEEDSSQEMTASQKRVTFQLPGDIGRRLLAYLLQFSCMSTPTITKSRFHTLAKLPQARKLYLLVMTAMTLLLKFPQRLLCCLMQMWGLSNCNWKSRAVSYTPMTARR